MYASSAEGIRSRRVGIRFADTTTDHRVALIGDSNAFSLQVPFDASLGRHLGSQLGPAFQVLNFGVDGYGIGQTLVRYKRDVRGWRPDTVLVVFIQHDLWRSMAVYPFLSWGWPGYLVKPRFTLRPGAPPTVVNYPLPSLRQILDVPRPRALPFIDLDVNSAAMKDISSADGAKPMFIYLPRRIGPDELTPATFARAGLEYIDMTDCVSVVPEAQRRVPSGHHYTDAGNAAIARCIVRTMTQTRPRRVASVPT